MKRKRGLSPASAAVFCKRLQECKRAFVKAAWPSKVCKPIQGTATAIGVVGLTQCPTLHTHTPCRQSTLSPYIKFPIFDIYKYHINIC